MSSRDNPEDALNQLFSPDELRALMAFDLAVLINDVFATAETILRRRDPEAGESALATLRISKKIAMEDIGLQMARYMLMTAVEVLGDSSSRSTFKMELLALSRMRGVAS